MKSARELVEEAMERFRKRCTGELVAGQVLCDQPYDSDWEREFQWQLQKNLPDWFTLRNQVPFGPYRADFVFTDIRDKRMWIVEFDGKTFHNADRDEKRDANIMRYHPEVQAIVRVDASTGHYEYIETRGILSKLIPECFDMKLSNFHQWRHDDGVFSARIFDFENHQMDSWTNEDGDLREGAPMRDLKISIVSRHGYYPFEITDMKGDDEDDDWY